MLLSVTYSASIFHAVPHGEAQFDAEVLDQWCEQTGWFTHFFLERVVIHQPADVLGIIQHTGELADDALNVACKVGQCSRLRCEPEAEGCAEDRGNKAANRIRFDAPSFCQQPWLGVASQTPIQPRLIKNDGSALTEPALRQNQRLRNDPLAQALQASRLCFTTGEVRNAG